MSFLQTDGGYRSLIDRGVAIKFSLLGKALSMAKFSPFSSTSIQTVEVLSILQQIGVNQIEIAINQNNVFSILGVVDGEDVAKIVNYLDKDRNCIFTGRLNSKTGDISYQQTFYVYKTGFNFSEIRKMVQ